MARDSSRNREWGITRTRDLLLQAVVIRWLGGFIDDLSLFSYTFFSSITGEDHYSLSRQFRIGHSTVNDIVHETCREIYLELKDEHLQMPKTHERWVQIMKEFERSWNFPNCVGALDGKHIVIKKPAKSGSIYINYKKSFSIILLAVVDANYKFIYTDVGAPGSQGDAGVWQTTPLQEAILNKKAGLPNEVKVASAPDILLPPVFVADDAFPIGGNMMKPFGGTSLTADKRVFNYR